MAAGEPRRKPAAGVTKEPRTEDLEVEKQRSLAVVAFRRTCRDMGRMADWCLELGSNGFHVGMRILGPCLVCLALGLKGFVTYTFFVHALPEMEDAGLLGCGALSVLGVFLLANTIYNYGKAIFTDAGTPPEYEKVVASELADSESAIPLRQCGKCNLVKPPRTHHCSVCGRCVMKMDHHCPWVNNCVGHKNYRYFCLFMLFLSLSCLFIIVVFGTWFSDIVLHFRRRSMTREARQCIMTSFMICCSILVSLLVLGGFHVFLVLTNQSTIEFQVNMIRRRESRKNGEYYRNPYDLGRTRNFQQVFGPNVFLGFRWLFTCLAKSPTGDGLDFPSISRKPVRI